MASYRYAAEPAGPVVDSSDIKRPKSAWGLFLDEYKKKCGSRGGIEKFNELQKAASVEWKSLSAEEKAVSDPLNGLILFPIVIFFLIVCLALDRERENIQ